MDSNEVGRYWDANAPVWIGLSRRGYYVYRDVVNTPAFLATLPDISGMIGLDLGCGEGQNTRLLAMRGARMIGLDISPHFIAAAADIESSRPLGLRYVIGDGTTLPFRDQSVDFVTGFMSLMDIPRPDVALSEALRVLRPEGFIQFSIEHPCTSTPERRWVTDDPGERIALAVGGYFEQSEYIGRWIFSAAPPEVRAQSRPFAIPRFPRTIAWRLNALATAGFVLEPLASPAPTRVPPRTTLTSRTRASSLTSFICGLEGGVRV